MVAIMAMEMARQSAHLAISTMAQVTLSGLCRSCTSVFNHFALRLPGLHGKTMVLLQCPVFSISQPLQRKLHKGIARIIIPFKKQADFPVFKNSHGRICGRTGIHGFPF